MRMTLENYDADGIWHFTDRSNLASIKDHGLCSFAEMKRRGIEIPASGGNEWSHEADERKGLHEYIHLVFVTDHPMLYHAKQERHIRDAVWLKISLSVLDESGVLFSSDVSNKTGVPILDAEQAKAGIDFEVLFEFMDWSDPEILLRRNEARKSEILVPNFIPYEKIIECKNG